MWLPYYFCSLGVCIYTGCLNIHGTNVTALLFLLTRCMHIYRVSQYSCDPCDCPIISAHSVYAYILGVSIYMGPMWLPYYFCSLGACLYTGCLNIHVTHVTALLFLLTRCMHIYRVSQYSCDCPIISAHSVYAYIQGVSIFMWLPYYFCSLGICIYVGCLNIHVTHVTALLFLLTRCMHIYWVSQYSCDCPIISAHSVYAYIQGVSIFMWPMWLPYYFCSLGVCIYTGCLNIYVTALLFLLTRYMHICRVSQNTWDQCDSPIISAHSVYAYIQGVSIFVTALLFLLTRYMHIYRVSKYSWPMWLPYYFCSLSVCIYTGFLNIHVTALLFLLTRYMHIYRVSQYTCDPCDCPIISAHSVYANIQGVSICMWPMWLPYYFCSLGICIYTRCPSIHGVV